jgi:hypothetical protein
MGFYGQFSNPHLLKVPNGIHGSQNFKSKSFLFYHFLCFFFQKIKLEGTFGHFLHESTIYGFFCGPIKVYAKNKGSWATIASFAVGSSKK